MSFEEFESLDLAELGAERCVQLAIQCCIDMGATILAHLGLDVSDEYKEVMLTLGREGIIPFEFAEEDMVRLVGLRNRLVHLYWRVTPVKFTNSQKMI